LDALVLESEDRTQRLDQSRLGEAGDADQQPVAAGEQRDQRLIDDLALAEDDAADALADEGEAGAERFDLGEELAGVFRRRDEVLGIRSHEIGSLRQS
jgi:hypothetical protein